MSVGETQEGKDTSSVISSPDAATNTVLKESITSKVENSLFTFIISLNNKGERTTIFNILLMVVLHGYMLWLGLLLGIQPSYNYGEIGSWIARSLNFPMTFGFDYLPYNAAVIVSAVIFSIALVGAVNLVVAFRLLYRMNKYQSKVKTIARLVNSILCVVSMPLIWMTMGFVKCNYGVKDELDVNDEAQEVLQRYPTIACFSGTNIVMMAIGIISSVMSMGFTAQGVLTLYDPHPKKKDALYCNQRLHICNYCIRKQPVLLYCLFGSRWLSNCLCHLLLGRKM